MPPARQACARTCACTPAPEPAARPGQVYPKVNLEMGPTFVHKNMRYDKMNEAEKFDQYHDGKGRGCRIRRTRHNAAHAAHALLLLHCACCTPTAHTHRTPTTRPPHAHHTPTARAPHTRPAHARRRYASYNKPYSVMAWLEQTHVEEEMVLPMAARTRTLTRTLILTRAPALALALSPILALARS